MPSRRRLATVLLVAAVVLLTTPLYAHAVLPIEDRKSARLLGARPLGESYDGHAVNASEDVVGTWEDEYLVDVVRYRDRVDRDLNTLLPCTEEGPPAVDVLERATATGRARTADAEVGSTLACIDDRYAYLGGRDGNDTVYYAFSVASTGGTTTVRTDPVALSTVADHVRERELVHYGDLSAADQRTVDRIVESRDPSSEYAEHGGYRPVHDSPVLDRTPMLLRKGGTTYVVELYGWVDGPDVERLVVLGLAEVLGAAALLGAGWTWRSGRRRDEDPR